MHGRMPGSADLFFFLCFTGWTETGPMLAVDVGTYSASKTWLSKFSQGLPLHSGLISFQNATPAGSACKIAGAALRAISRRSSMNPQRISR